MKKGRLLHVPAMRDCDIVYRHCCTLFIVYYIGAAWLLVFRWICIGHGAGLSRETLFRSLGCTATAICRSFSPVLLSYFGIYARFRPCWGLVRSVRSRQGCFELFIFDVTAHEDTGQKFTGVWAIEPWASGLVFAKCKPDLTYRVCV